MKRLNYLQICILKFKLISEFHFVNFIQLLVLFTSIYEFL